MLGLLIGGRTAQAHATTTLTWGLAALTAISAALALTARSPLVVVVALVFLLGGAGYVTNPALQSRVFTLAPDAPTLVGATNTAAFNVGNTLAPMLGGLTIDAGYGYTSVAWVGAGLAAAGCALAAWAGRLERARPETPARFEKVFQNS
ncbi:MFS transporter [Streptomyces sp. PmtG]